MNHLKTFLLTIDDDAFQLEDDSFLLLGSAPCLNYYHVYELLSSFNRVIIPFRDPVNRSLILFAPILVLFTPTLAPSRDCVASPFMVRQAHHERTTAH